MSTDSYNWKYINLSLLEYIIVSCIYKNVSEQVGKSHTFNWTVRVFMCMKTFWTVQQIVCSFINFFLKTMSDMSYMTHSYEMNEHYEK